jgi:WD40 repeat protein
MARDSMAGELGVKAEGLFKELSDRSSLLELTAWKISPIAKAQTLIRAAWSDYSVQTVLRGHEGGVFRAAFAPDGQTVVPASWDKTARLWDVASGKELHVLRGHKYTVERAAFTPDGKTVVTASWDGTVRLWRCVVCRPVDELASRLQKISGVS